MTWCGLDGVAFDAIEAELGSFNNLIRNVALLPANMISSACTAATVQPPTPDGGVAPPPHGLTPIQVAQVGLVWRIARRIVAPSWDNFTDVDPFAPAAAVAAATVPAGAAATAPVVTGRKISLKAVLDQSDETEVPVADESKVRIWSANWISFAHGPPLDEEEATVEQLSALDYRVTVQDGSPYADFAVFTPYNRRISKANKFTAFIPQPDGTFLAKEVPGPQNYVVWKYCWRTFRCSVIQLGIVREAALTSYSQVIESLVQEWPDCWSLVYMADDKARAEGLARKRRAILSSIASGSPPPPLWDAAAPWTACFMALANDDQYWNRQVRHLAVSWLTRGKRGTPQTREQLITAQSFSGGSPQAVSDAGLTEVPAGATIQRHNLPGQGQSKQAKTKRRLQSLAAAASSPSTPRVAPYAGGKDKGGKGKDKGKGRGGKGGSGSKGGRHSVDQNGAQICYSWNNGSGACAQVPVGSPCPAGRSHACSICLSRAHASKDHA